MRKLESSKFVKWEGDIYRLDRMSDGPIFIFVLKDGKFIPASGKLGATIEYEGKTVNRPS